MSVAEEDVQVREINNLKEKKNFLANHDIFNGHEKQ